MLAVMPGIGWRERELVFSRVVSLNVAWADVPPQLGIGMLLPDCPKAGVTLTQPAIELHSVITFVTGKPLTLEGNVPP